MIPEITLGTGAIAWITALITIALGLAVKDLVTTFVSGFLFKINKTFNEGDLVYLEGQVAVIIKIGMRQTVFEMDDERGHIWRYIYNDRVKYLKLEKVIKEKEKENEKGE